MNKSIIDELDELKRVIEEAKRVPFSKYITVDRDIVLGIITRIEVMLPDEVKQAVNIVKQRDAILKDAYEEKNRILNEAEKEFKKRVEESLVLQEAHSLKEKILKEAMDEKRQIVEEAYRYVVDIMSKVENIFEKARNSLKESREAIENEITNRQDH